MELLKINDLNMSKVLKVWFKSHNLIVIGLKCHSHQSERNTMWPSVLVDCDYPFMYEPDFRWLIPDHLLLNVFVNPSCLSITLNAVIFSVEETYGERERRGRGRFWGIFFKILLTIYCCLLLHLKSYLKQLHFGFRNIQIHHFFFFLWNGPKCSSTSLLYYGI